MIIEVHISISDGQFAVVGYGESYQSRVVKRRAFVRNNNALDVWR